jgi:hypothetical protein
MLRPMVSRPVTPIWGLRSDLYYCQTVASLLMRGALSDERTGLSLTIAAGARQAQLFSGPSPVGLATIFYCLRFEISLFVVSYNSQGHGGGIRPASTRESQLNSRLVLLVTRGKHCFQQFNCYVIQLSHGPRREHLFPVSPLMHVRYLLRSNVHCLQSNYLSICYNIFPCS